MEVYIDDMMVKSFKSQSHIDDLQRCFTILNRYDMKLNLEKSTFAVTSGEFLGYIVTKREMKVNLRKISAILELP